MLPLYLTPTALSDLALFIFAAFIAGYLGYLARQARGYRPLRTIFLARTFAAVAGNVLLDFLNQTLYPDLAFWFLPLQSVVITFGMVWLVQFAYHVPELYPERRRECSIALGLTLLLPLWEAGYAVRRYILLLDGKILYRPPNADLFLGAVFVWVLVVFLRQVGRADARPLPLWRKLRSPQGRPARAARGFALVVLLPVGLVTVLILQNEAVLTETAANATLSLGLLLTLLAFVLVYLNYLPEKTSFMVRLVAITLAFFLGLLGVVGHANTPAFVAAYQNHQMITAPRSLRFTPNAGGGYDILQIPYHYEPFDNSFDFAQDRAQGRDELGVRLTYGDGNQMRLPLGFEFPFYDQRWSELFVLRHGYVAFGAAPDLINTSFHYGSAPSIYLMGAALWADYLLDPPSGVYAHTTPGQLTLTWLEMPEEDAFRNRYTFQLQLYADGVFEMTYVALPTPQQYDIAKRWRTARMIAALPGYRCDALQMCVAPSPAPEHIRFNTGLPLSSGPGGVVEDYHLAFRAALHRFLASPAWLILFSVLLVSVGLPLAFRQNLVQPLQNLLAGVRRVDAGDLDVKVPVQFQDEFGYLTQAFNQMAAELGALVGDLEGRVAERIARLADTTAYLDNILRSATDYAIVTVDRDLRITYFNPLAEALYGVPAADALGKPIAAICAQERDPERFEAGLRRIETHGAHEYVMVQESTDRPRHIFSRLSGIFDEQGQLIGYARFSRDISERVHTEARLLTQQRSIAVLEERAQIGQELHDRLGQVFGFLSLQSQAARALFAADKREAGDRTLTRLAAVAQDAHSQVREFILGMRGAAAASRDFWDTLQAYTDRLQRLYQMRVTLNLPAARAPLLPPDRELHLLRLIQEALANARQHSGVNQARVSFQQEGDMMRVTIADAGRGFDPLAYPISRSPLSDALELSRLNQPGALSGDGQEHFGLLGMYEHAAALGGALQIRSRPGEGTQVILTFSPGAKGEGDTTGLAALKDLRVLLVDDQPIFLEGLGNLLTVYGLHVVGMAQDGLSAQELARTTRPDVIVMDIQMPICDGITATRRIKQEFPEVEIVMLSVSAEDETLFDALKAGASGYLLKSMQARDFFLLITGLEEGIPPLAPRLAGKVLAEFRGHLQTEVTLTGEQTRILSLVARGRTYRQIALELDVSERTVKRYMKEIMHLLHLGSRAEAVAYARRRGL